MQALIGLTRQELAFYLQEAGIPEKQINMRVKQLWSALYTAGAKHVDEITTLSKDLRVSLADKFSISRLEIVTRQDSEDGTIKWLFKTLDKNLVETVFIPDGDRGTVCISSQVGCTLNCSFCHTGTQKLVRNLTAEEILGQILTAKDELNEWAKASADKHITNIVLMGMGEPLYNYDEVKKAMLIAMDAEGIALGKRRITLSTSGVVPLIKTVGDELGVNLAISLHATTDDLRNELVPLNKKYPIKELLQACREYPVLSNARRITFEYVMLKGVNDSLEDAKRLVALLKNIPAKINLIPFNPWPNTKYECSDWEQIYLFADFVNQCGYASPIRMPRGRDILAACGQLKSASEKIRKSIALKQLAHADILLADALLADAD